MGSRKGIPNRRTLLRDYNMRVAAAQAELVDKNDPRRISDSLDIIEYVMRYHFREALDTELSTDREKRRANLADVDRHFAEAVQCAGIAVNFRRPRLSAVKVGQDRENPLQVVEGKTSQEAMVELLELIGRTGILPRRLKQMIDVTPEGVVEVPVKEDEGAQ